jgi:hypothetical protein
MVMPRALSSWKTAITSTLVRVSRLPVGSSARRIAGSLTRARAMATRCCWPPESSGRFVMHAIAEADLIEHRQSLPARVGNSPGAVVEQRQLDVLHGRGARQQVEALEDEADLLVADRRELVLPEAVDPLAVEGVGPRRRRSRQPRMFISVDLPEPEAPMNPSPRRGRPPAGRGLRSCPSRTSS